MSSRTVAKWVLHVSVSDHVVDWIIPWHIQLHELQIQGTKLQYTFAPSLARSHNIRPLRKRRLVSVYPCSATSNVGTAQFSTSGQLWVPSSACLSLRSNLRPNLHPIVSEPRRSEDTRNSSPSSPWKQAWKFLVWAKNPMMMSRMAISLTR